MAEQSPKTYISVHEFVESWEKEVYELTNLDYFVYQLINFLAAEIETVYFSALSPGNLLQLHTEETGTLCFNMGDSLQQFLEKNCLEHCKANCPLKTNERLQSAEILQRKTILGNYPAKLDQCQYKKQALHLDLTHFVVVDALLEFYHFEKGFMIEEADPDLLSFAQFISDRILEYIQNRGQKLLAAASENAGSDFDRLIKTDNQGSLEALDFDLDEDYLSEGEEWKLNGSGSAEIIEIFKENYKPAITNSIYLTLLDRFREFLVDFLEINQIDKLAIEELQEFFTVIVVHEVLNHDLEQLGEAARLFSQLTQYLDFNQQTDLHEPFQGFLSETYPELTRTLRLVQNYSRGNPLLSYLLSETAGSDEIVDGFFEIISISGATAEIEDIHLKTRFKPLQLGNLEASRLKKGDILHLQLIPEGLEFRLTHLEMLYPAIAKNYLY